MYNGFYLKNSIYFHFSSIGQWFLFKKISIYNTFFNKVGPIVLFIFLVLKKILILIVIHIE